MLLRRWLLAILASCAVLLLVGRAITTLVVDHAWYDSLGTTVLFWEQFVDSVVLQGTLWLAGTVFAFVNLYAVRRTILAVALPVRVANLEFAAMLPSRRLLSITVLLSALIGFALSVPFTDWTTVAMARHGIPFGEIEGILDRDLGFYVFHLPLEETAYVWSLTSLVSLIAIVMMLYAITRSLRMEGRRVVASTHVRRHLSVLGALVLMVLAWSYRLDAFDLLQRGSGDDGLFLSIDHMVSLKADRILSFTCGIAALIFLRAGWLGQLRLAFVTLTLVLVGALGGRHVLPIALNNSALIGDPARRDVPYMATRTFFSRRAYDVDAMQIASREATAAIQVRLTLTELARQVGMWDAAEIRRRQGAVGSSAQTVGGIGSGSSSDGHANALVVRRPNDAENDWSIVAVDVTKPELPEHVFGFPLNTQSGDNAEQNQPIVAPGLTRHRLVQEPAGVLGAPVRTWWSRIAHAWATRDPSLLRADSLSGSAPRLVTHRDVRDRVARVTPMFTQGSVVFPIVSDDALIWAVNLYSASSYYPLSQRWVVAGTEHSYFRFTATALVDAASGRVRIVPGDRLDPIAKVWLAPIASLVVLAKDLPTALAAELPPAIDAAVLQIQTFGRFGSRRESAPKGHVPDSLMSGNGPPLYRVATSHGAVPAWSIPLLRENDLVDGVMTAVGGRVRGILWDSAMGVPLQWSVSRELMRAALDSIPVVSDGTRRTAQVRIGRIQVLSGENGPILVQTLYGNRGSSTPFVRQVAVLEGAHLYLGSTILDAVSMNRQDGATAGRVGVQNFGSPGERDRRTTQLYETMKDALRRGDWTRFGAAFDTLGMVLGKPPQ